MTSHARNRFARAVARGARRERIVHRRERRLALVNRAIAQVERWSA